MRPIEHILLSSSSKGDLAGVETAFDLGVDLNYNNSCALRNAAENGHLEIVNFLLRNGAPIDNRALLWAAANGYTKICQVLIDFGADVQYDKGEPLMMALKNGHISTASLLIKRGADISARRLSELHILMQQLGYTNQYSLFGGLI